MRNRSCWREWRFEFPVATLRHGYFPDHSNPMSINRYAELRFFCFREPRRTIPQGENVPDGRKDGISETDKELANQFEQPVYQLVQHLRTEGHDPLAKTIDGNCPNLRDLHP